MKRFHLFLAVIMTALLIPNSAWADFQVTVAFTHGEDTIASYNDQPQIAFYYKGENIGQAYSPYNYDEPWLYVLDIDDSYAGKTVSYKSSLGHIGKIALSASEPNKLSLDCKKLIITIKNGQDVPLSYQNLSLTDENNEDYYCQTDFYGKDSVYLYVGVFQYYFDNQRGSFTLTDDDSLNIVKQVPQTVTLRVNSRYGDFPQNGSSFYLYKYGDKNNYQHLYGYTQVKPGSYWIKDDAGTFTGKIDIVKDTVVWLDYYKVTFDSKTGNIPNENQNISITADPESYILQNVTTNSKGQASQLLLPGEYTYEAGGTTGTFTLGEEDKTVNISTSRVVITLNTDEPEELDNQEYRWFKEGEYGNYVNQKNGKLTIAAAPGDYKLAINDVSVIDVKINEGDNAKNITLYSVKFTSNIVSPGRVYINETYNFNYDTKYLLPAGTYSYTTNYGGDAIGQIELNQNKVIPITYSTLTVTVSDNKGVVEGERIDFGRYSNVTDENGKVKFQVLTGSQGELSATSCDVSKDVTVDADKDETLTLDPYVNFNVESNGQPLTTIGLLISENGGGFDYNVNVKNGVAKARLDPTKKYSVGHYHGTTTITEGSTLKLGYIHITTQGAGVAFPMENWETTSSYPVVVGATVRLTAIPVSDGSFKEWNINGTKFTDGMIDLTITTPRTTATAVFNGSASTHTQIRNTSVNTTFSYDDSYVYLPSEVQGKVSIYSSDGKLVKSIGVAGDKVGIYDLPQGTYVLTLTPVTGDTQVARFLKK
ncbi:MAG: hypothetical protein IKX55_06715 [Bacteroidaceae bacterium]|nr:hypothetical protein [Bacteroidaceae bacterium]